MQDPIQPILVETFDCDLRPDLFSLCKRIREQVFVIEQHVSPDLEWDGLDAGAIQFIAWAPVGKEKTAVGTARLRLFEGYAKAERVAVSRDARRRRVGEFLMRKMAEEARARGRRAIQLNAQVSALSFYEHLGYEAQGPVFVEAGIDHRSMTQHID